MRGHFWGNILFSLIIGLTAAPAWAQGIIIDHTCTDISLIPETWLNQAKSDAKVHYAHTSHGSQVTVGLERLGQSNNLYSYYPDNCQIPLTADYLSLMDGQQMPSYCETYVTPDLYWQGTTALDITRNVLNTKGANISMWAWCTQLDGYTQSETQAYLDAMNQFESEYPHITFIYMTGNAQTQSQTRYTNNNLIRDYCRANNKILFDFADLDCWYNGEQNVQNGIPMEHPHYNGDEAGHTTYESCENKGRAFWWLMARISGWDGTGDTSDGTLVVSPSALDFSCTAQGTPPAAQIIYLSFQGIDTLDWSASVDQTWLSCSPTSGTEAKDISASADQTGMSAGTYTGTITITADNAGNSPLTVSVNLTVSDGSGTTGGGGGSGGGCFIGSVHSPEASIH